MTTPTAKDALIEAAKRHANIDPTAYFNQEIHLAKRLAVFGLIDLLGKDDPMRDVLKAYQEFETLSFPVMLSEDKCAGMETAIEDMTAAAEAKGEEMWKELESIKEQLGIAE